MIELYKMVSNRDDKEKVRALMNELTAYRLNDDDPIMKLLDTAKNYVES